MQYMSNIWILFFSYLTWASPLPNSVEIKTIKTPHFEIYYYAEQQDLAYHYAKQLEKGYGFLNSIFLSKPQERIPFVINDGTDLANGFATRVPYPYSMLFPVLPDLNDSLADIGEWSLELSTHELAHVISFEPAGGVMKPLRSVFGTIVAPNLLLPSWWKEGLSVWAETAVGQAGRLRSVYQEASLRSWIDEKDLQLEDVSMANESLTTWPWGSRPYLFGSLAMGHLVETYGTENTQKIVEQHGKKVPYFLDPVTKNVIQKSYKGLYMEALESWKEKANQQVQTLKQKKFDEVQLYPTRDLSVRSPSLSSNEKYIAWVSNDKTPNSRLQVSDLSTAESFMGFESRFVREARFFPSSDKVLLNAIMPASSTENYSDLFIYDINTKKTKRLTRKLRGREARVNPTETQIVFVGLEGGRTHLKTIEIESQSVQKHFETGFDERIASPLYLDNNRILFSVLEKNQEKLKIYDLTSQKTQTLPQFGKRMRRPIYKNKTLYFLSDHNGTFNLYSSNDFLASPPKILSHTKTQILDYDISQTNTIYATVLTREGSKLYQWQPEERREIPKIGPMYDKYKKPTDLTTINSNDIQETERSYKLWPHYWIPFVSGSSAENGALFSVSTSGQDPSLQHTYNAQILYDSGIQELSYSMNYLNMTQRWPIQLLSNRYIRSFAGSDETYSNQTHAIALAPDTSSLNLYWSSQLALLYAKYEDRLRSYERSGAQVSMAYSNAEQTIWMISPEKGYTAQVSATHFLSSSNLESYNQFRLRGATYLSGWNLPEHHVISIDAKALITDNRIPSILGDASTFFVNELTSNFLIRGYFEGQFIGRNLLNSNIEYRFPIASHQARNDTFPLFIKRVHAAVAYDTLNLDGFAFQEQQNMDISVDRNKSFSSVGADLKVDTTVGYILPIQWVVGLHQPLQKEFRKDPNFLFQIRTSLGF